MSMLIVDDSPPVIRLLHAFLERAGYDDVICADGGVAALRYLGIEPPLPPPAVDCILLDIVMPGIDGIEVCRRIKATPAYADTPVIMVTIRNEVETLRDAFIAGAHDYISKPVREVELAARLKSAIALKKEIEARKAREDEILRLTEKLAEANGLLAELTITDPLTKVGNRHYFMECLDKEWHRSFRESAPLSIILISIDRFQEFNDQLGKDKGDECLKMIALALQISLRRATDSIGRYSEHQFAIVMPNTPLPGAQTVAGTIRQSINDLEIKHSHGFVTISQGIAAIIPSGELAIQDLLFMAEEAVTSAQGAGSNQVHFTCYKNHQRVDENPTVSSTTTTT